MKCLAVQLPAFCPLTCKGCRTIELNRKGHVPGNIDEIKHHLDKLKKDDSLFISSTGEPGFTDGYEDLVGELVNRGVEVAVCCANKRSIMKHFIRAEISRSEEQDKTSPKAIERARELGIPYVATVVNYGKYDDVNPEKLAEELDSPSAIIIRQAQREGDAKRFLDSAHKKETQIWQRNGVYLGKVFPIPCFREFRSYRDKTDVTCINHMGDEVQWLGDSAGGNEELVQINKP